MRIKLINPNTTQRMTEAMGRCARDVAAPGTEVIAVNPTMGPPSIEGYYDEALATPGLLAEVAAGEREGCDGYVIACFGDPGLYAARELARGPVIGIAEAAMHAASVLAPGFSVVTTLARTCGMAWHLAERYGMKRFCRNVRATDVAVLDLDKPGSAARRIILDECRRALAEDGSDAIVLGCAGMAELCAEIEDALGAPVIEGVTAAVKWTEALVALRLSTAKRGDYARPLAKRYDGALASFSPTDADPNPRAPRGSTVISGAKSPENGGMADLSRVNTTESGPHIHSV
ncbi:aspartate/glutamate racemase family protein [Paraburkholderia sp. BL17N1]|uniref:aspartate/glutamate racemase family protein n=1 Tax=Paraburkholderia sp. BL17N1 TaxID=1938798 RepID=UPI000EB519FD|nr:aspartate/glutamate racemase family protein [Paraburkholderia sp. BL17N1]RKR45334.1 allantoin racemase [Paraburkholderia sp. BL17N1]